MNGKLLGALIVGAAAIAGIAMYYLQVYAFYRELPGESVQIELTSVVTGAPEPLVADAIEAIDSDSSPLRFRACLTLSLSLATLTESFVIYDGAVPLTAPGWFDCFDAAALGLALEEGRAIAFLGQENIRPGVDRVVAVYDDGRAYAWHQLNATYE